MIAPCTTNGQSNHGNPCVIRLGISLCGAGIDLSSYPGVFCSSKHGRNDHLREQ